MLLAILLVLAGSLLAGNSAGQSPQATPMLQVGDRVRLTTVDNSSIIGRLVNTDGSQLTLVVSEATRMAPAVERSINRNSLALLERSEGYGSKIRTGALIGGGVGVVAGVTVGLFAAMGAEDSGPMLTVPIIFGAMGVLGGAAIGAGGGERWTTLPFDARVGLQVGAPSLPLAVRIRASF